MMFAAYSSSGCLLGHVDDLQITAGWNQFSFAVFERGETVDAELEKLCEQLMVAGVSVNLRRFGKGWKCWLHCSDSRLYSVPAGEGQTATEAVNAACDQRLELLLRDGN